jgi:hypothetical protein
VIAAVAAGRRAGPPSGLVAVAALGRAEIRRLVRSPLLCGGGFLALALGAAWDWTRMPTWATFNRHAGMSSMVLAGALLLAGHLAASRDQRAAAAASTDVMPTTPARRGLGLLALVPAAALGGAVLYLTQLLVMLPAWPVGRFDRWAPQAAVVIPALGVAIGIVVGRWIPRTAAGPLAVIAVAVVLGALPVMAAGPGGVPWSLFPVPQPPWTVGADSPTGWHLLYLAGLLAAILALLTLRYQRLASALVIVVAATLAGLAVNRQVQATPTVVDEAAERALTGPAVLDCELHRGVRYCALPHYAGWIPLWREAVEPVVRNLPPTASRPAVHQIGDADYGDVLTAGRREIVTTTTWGRHGRWSQESREGMTAAYATAATGLSARGDGRPTQFGSCSGVGQHRTVVALWLLARALPDGARRLAAGDLRLPGVRYDPADAKAAADLLTRPLDQVTAFLAAHWTAVLNPSGTALAAWGVTTKPPMLQRNPDVSQAGADRGVCR